MLKKQSLCQIVISLFGGTGQQCVDACEQLDARDFTAVQDGTQACPPFIRRAAVFPGQHCGCLAEPTAYRELAAGAAKPGVEIRAVWLDGGHAASLAEPAGRGQEDDCLLRPLFPAGYFTGLRAAVTGWFFNAAI